MIQKNFFLKKRKWCLYFEILNNFKINFYNNFIIFRIHDKSWKGEMCGNKLCGKSCFYRSEMHFLKAVWNIRVYIRIKQDKNNIRAPHGEVLRFVTRELKLWQWITQISHNRTSRKNITNRLISASISIHSLFSKSIVK